MDFLFGTVNSYVKGIELNNKWQMKKKNNDFTPEKKLTEMQRKNEQFKASYKQQKELEKEHTDEMLSDIHKKIEAGTKLTPEEMNYLQSKDPAMYQKVKEIEREVKQYEAKLKKCKTKDEVNRVKMQKFAEVASAMGSVKNNPAIPEGQKLAMAQHIMKRLNQVQKCELKIAKSGHFSSLPTDEEYNKAMAELRGEKLPETAKENTKTDNSENIKEITSPAPQKNENHENDKPDTESYELQKVKRSKAKSRYLETINDTQPTATNIMPNIIDIKE